MTKKYIYIFICTIIGLSFNLIDSFAQANTEEPVYDEVFKVVEQMPEFPGCEDVSKKNERSICAKKAMLDYVYRNLKYPIKAKENGTEGTCVLQFVINKLGEATNVKIVRDLKDGCGLAAVEVIESMKTNKIIWIPGSQRGAKVNVLYTFPVKFRLDKK